MTKRTISILFVMVCFAVCTSPLRGQEILSAPPPGPVRQPAEFEPMQGVLIAYPFGISYALIAEMSQDTEVVTIVLDSIEQSLVEFEYKRNGVNLSNCSFLLAPSDSYWTRDFGPWFMITCNMEQGIVDNLYPWPQPLDDLIPQAYGLDQGIPVFKTKINHEGGNYMTDGKGTAISTDLVWKDNPGVPHMTIDDIITDYAGIHTYHIVPDALNSFLKHVDCFAKYLSPDTIMVLEVPPSDPNYNSLENAVAYFENQISCYGTPYEVVRVYGPNKEPYTNSLILNKKVLVPIIGSAWDDDAIASYEEAMPGYEVLGFSGSWYWFDALHCRTMGITDRYMLHIDHIPLLDRPPAAQGFPIEAEIIAFSGQPFMNNTPAVYWKTTGSWTALPMTHTGGDHYLAHIPAQPADTVIQYYIHVEDGSGRSEDHPYIGEEDAHTFTVNTLGTDANALSANTGGSIQFHLHGGNLFGNRNYYLMASLSGTSPGLVLPSGQVLPLNWDAFTDLVLALANSAPLTNFHGTLDGSGTATAALNTLGPVPRELSGISMYFAFMLDSPFDFVSNPAEIRILD